MIYIYLETTMSAAAYISSYNDKLKRHSTMAYIKFQMLFIFR